MLDTHRFLVTLQINHPSTFSHLFTRPLFPQWRMIYSSLPLSQTLPEHLKAAAPDVSTWKALPGNPPAHLCPLHPAGPGTIWAPPHGFFWTLLGLWQTYCRAPRSCNHLQTSSLLLLVVDSGPTTTDRQKGQRSLRLAGSLMSTSRLTSCILSLTIHDQSAGGRRRLNRHSEGACCCVNTFTPGSTYIYFAGIDAKVHLHFTALLADFSGSSPHSK